MHKRYDFQRNYQALLDKTYQKRQWPIIKRELNQNRAHQIGNSLVSILSAKDYTYLKNRLILCIDVMSHGCNPIKLNLQIISSM